MGRVKHGMSCMSEKRGGKNRMVRRAWQINRSFVLRTEKLLKYPRIREVVRSTPQPHMCGKERGKCQTQLPAAIIPRVKRGDDVSRSVGTGHGVWDMAFARVSFKHPHVGTGRTGFGRQEWQTGREPSPAGVELLQRCNPMTASPIPSSVLALTVDAQAAIAGKTLWVSLLAGRGLKRSMSPHSWRHGTWLFLDEQRSGDVVLDEVGETTLSDRLHEG
ncbi:hypothetical protein DIZ76_016454 [Coccidioides immitis]|nr:hypothetical protein DIZ76_016454 [Coccidioides immitis]